MLFLRKTVTLRRSLIIWPLFLVREIFVGRPNFFVGPTKQTRPATSTSTRPAIGRVLESEKMAAAEKVAGESSRTKTKRLKIAVIHPDLGIGTPSFLSHRYC
jgi:hypothetical protein